MVKLHIFLFAHVIYGCVDWLPGEDSNPSHLILTTTLPKDQLDVDQLNVMVLLQKGLDYVHDLKKSMQYLIQF